MPDMLVKLYELPDAAPLISALEEQGVTIRRALAAEKHIVARWVAETFSRAWASECEVALAHQPVGCFIAVEADEIIGFACYDAAHRNFFGPTGVHKNERGRGVGKALLVAALAAMRDEGYAYAIIGGVGPSSFYRQTVGAVLIEDSAPGIYRGLLTREE
jgi:GNAT superfamily N-acetyltransferase